jgi:hypothetical protein
LAQQVSPQHNEARNNEEDTAASDAGFAKPGRNRRVSFFAVEHLPGQPNYDCDTSQKITQIAIPIAMNAPTSR